MPVPEPMQQLWDILRLAPSNFRRIHIACDPRQQPPGALRVMSMLIGKTLALMRPEPSRDPLHHHYRTTRSCGTPGPAEPDGVQNEVKVLVPNARSAAP